MRRSAVCAVSAWCGLWATTAANSASWSPFSALVRMCSSDDAREAQLRLIRDGEAMTLENAPVASESDEAKMTANTTRASARRMNRHD